MTSVEHFELRRAAAQRILDDAEQSLRTADGPTVTTRLEYGEAAAAILDNSDDADLIVIGTQRRGSGSGLLLGSVSRAVVMRATGPVAVISDSGSSEEGPIVGGVDDSREARSALRWAAEHAHRRRLPLKVVHAFQPQHVAGLLGITDLQPDIAWRARATRALTALVDHEVAQPHRLEIETVPAQAGPAAGLLGAAEGASLIVLGYSRPRQRCGGPVRLRQLRGVEAVALPGRRGSIGTSNAPSSRDCGMGARELSTTTGSREGSFASAGGYLVDPLVPVDRRPAADAKLPHAPALDPQE